MFTFTVDDDVELRLHEEWYAEELFALIDTNREHLGRWFPWVEQTEEVTDTLEFIRGAKSRYGDNVAIPTAVWFRGEIAGTLGLGGLNWQTRRGEIGYWLGKRFEGKGIITRSCRAIIEYAFAEMDLNRIVIRSAPENERSAAVAKRLGFTCEGTFRQVARAGQGRLDDLEVYSMLAEEWEKPGQ